MARRPVDAKTRALKQHGCLNPNAEAVRDELFLSNPFFDPRDLLQVRYEMLRRVREDGVPVSHAAASFGVSRPTWYQAQRAYEAGGLPGLLPDRPGPRRPHKLSDEVVEALRAAKSERPDLTAAEMVDPPTAQAGVPLRPTIPRRGPSRRRGAGNDARRGCGARRHCLLCRSTPGPRWRLGSPGPPREAPSMEVGRTGRVGSGVRGVHYFRAEGRGDGRRRRA